MSAQKEFRRLQRKLDDIGYMTNILRSITNKRYEVIINGEIVKVYKQRRNAKLFIIKLYNIRNKHRTRISIQSTTCGSCKEYSRKIF